MKFLIILYVTLLMTDSLVSAFHHNPISCLYSPFSSTSHRAHLGATSQQPLSKSQSPVNSKKVDINVNINTNSKDMNNGLKKSNAATTQVDKTCPNCTCGKADENGKDSSNKGEDKDKDKDKYKVGGSGTSTFGFILPIMVMLREPDVSWGTAQEALDILHGTQPHTDATLVWFALFVGYYMAQEHIMKKIASF